jgi:hypothetical protein
VGDYIRELEKTKGERTDQVKEGLEIYISLWKRAIDRGVIMESDGVDEALAKIEKNGGLYQAAGD